MSLFSHIPSRLFSPLASQKKELYADALLALYDLFQGQLTVKRNEVESALSQALEVRLVQTDFSDETDEEATGLSAKVQILVRRLKETGWIDYEMDRDSFLENVTLPDYASAIISALKGIGEERTREYNGYVFSTYSVLKTSLDNPDYRYRALVEAYNHTNAFTEALTSLYNNIRTYIQNIANMDDVNELLSEHFDVYAVQIARKVIEPIRTIDSVPRFKHQILEMLRQMEDDEQVFDSMVAEAMKSGQFATVEDAEADVRMRINSIEDIYSSVEKTLSEIDNKHSAYISSSVQRMRYMMSSDRGSKGSLVALLRHCSQNDDLVGQMADSIMVDGLQLVDSASFFDRIERKVKDDGPSQPILRLGQDEREVDTLFEELRKQYSNSRIDSFILSRMEGDELSGDSIAIDSMEDFLLFILATIRASEESSPYTVTFADGCIRRGSVLLPHCLFKRRK